MTEPAATASGFWRDNPGMVQLLGLCPLLAMSTSVVSAVSLGLATTLILAASGLVVALSRNFVPERLRIATFLLIVAALVTLLQLGMNAYLYPLYLMLGLYVPLIATNCLVLARAELFASRQNPFKALLDALASGGGLSLTLIIVGAVRELLGKGTLLSGIEKVLGASAQHYVFHVPRKDFGFLLAILPPGAFIVLGLLIALKNRVEGRDA
jgi:Na+-translocating ferredoxin:NAD+ oxidoreductase subunit E